MVALNSSAPRTFISDGYTVSSFIGAVPRSNGPVRFSFRPLLIEERSVLLDKLQKAKDGRQRDQLLAGTLAERIQDWNLTDVDASGEEIPADITARNILRLQSHYLWGRFCAIVVYGSDWGDFDPELAGEEKEEADQLALESAMTDTPIADVRENANLGN